MNLVLPEMGEGVIEATVSQWLKQPGDAVERMEPVVEVETDKVTTEIVADAAGILAEILINEGETVSVGTTLAIVQTSEAVKEQPTLVAAAVIESTPIPTKTNGANGSVAQSRKTEAGRVSPVVARMAAEHELDLTLIAGTGKHGRITKRDVVAFLEEVEGRDEKEETVEVITKRDTAKSFDHAPTTVNRSPQLSNVQRATDNVSIQKPLTLSNSSLVTLSPMRRAIAEHMVESVHTSPHATTIHEVDFSAVMAHRKVHKASFADKGVNLTFTAYIMQAVAEALTEFPMVNSSWHEDGLLLHQDINIGMATAIQDGAGLVVPVIKHAADYNLLGMARIVNELSTKARDNKLTAPDMHNGTFTVTNHGVSGSLFATPIINQPQAAILGVGAIKKQVVVIEDTFGNDATAIRPMAYLSLSFDHRILDGVAADGFVAAVCEKLFLWE
ncbi:MAG: dihydrolipoamide acetyltransferase family protein [Chloroflexota bacterium]